MPYKENVPYRWRISRGAESGETSETIYGYSDNVTQTAGTVWSGAQALTYLSTAAYVITASDDADDAAAGTGARTIEITGLLANYTQTTDTITTNGVTGVTSGVQFLRILKLEVGTAGSQNLNDGRVYTILDGTDSTFTAGGVPTSTSTYLGMIDSSTCKSLMAQYTVPTTASGVSGSKYGFVEDWWISNQNNVSNVGELWTRVSGKPWKLQERRGLVGGDTGNFYQYPTKYAAGTDIEIRAKASAGTALISAGFSVMVTLGD